MNTWYEGNVETNGITIHYHRTGNTGKPVLLLLHGITDSGRVWARVARDLHDDYDIVMPDARGHGQSDDLTSGFSIPLLADDVAGLITDLDLETPSIWGHSMGAITAATLAATYPALARAIVLEDPPLSFTAAAHNSASRERNAAEGSPAWPDFRTMSAEERLATAAALNPGWHADELAPWAESKAQFDPAVSQYLAEFQSYPWRDILAAIRCPTLLLIGDHREGSMVTPEAARDASTLLKQGQVKHIPGAGHNIHRDRYDETMQAVQALLHSH